MMLKTSLKTRLILVVLITFIVSAVVANIVSLYQTRESLKEYFDTQLFYFAKTISIVDKQSFQNSNITHLAPKNKSKSVKKHMSIDDDVLTFAIFDLNGKIIFSDGEDSRKFIFNANVFHQQDKTLIEKTKKYKIVWTLSENETFIVAVGQKLEYTNDVLFDILEEQIMPWVIILPILVVLIVLLITKGLKPLKTLTQSLSKRGVNDSSSLDKNLYPKELNPVVDALNSLFLKISNAVDRERRFTSNAAHELKTPLASIKIQAEVAKLSKDDWQTLDNALDNILVGIDRSTRLVEQLLALSRIEDIKYISNKEFIDWNEIIKSTIKELEFNAKNKDIKIKFLHVNSIKPLKGEITLLSLLIRNLLDNAIKYNYPKATININLYENKIIISDDGKGIDEAFLAQIGERFVRPSGQKQSGSGLGFSIVQQIAILHNLHVEYKNKYDGGFEVVISW